MPVAKTNRDKKERSKVTIQSPNDNPGHQSVLLKVAPQTILVPVSSSQIMPVYLFVDYIQTLCHLVLGPLITTTVGPCTEGYRITSRVVILGNASWVLSVQTTVVLRRLEGKIKIPWVSERDENRDCGYIRGLDNPYHQHFLISIIVSFFQLIHLLQFTSHSLNGLS